MRCAMLAAAVACGPGLAQQDPRELAQSSLLDAAGDAGRIESMMRVGVMNGGLWFTDPACIKEFHSVGEIKPERFHAFAGCLATLHLQASTRRDPMVDATIMTYEPGFEIEARVLDERSGPRLTWIGYEARHDLADALPTISGTALEMLRVAGDRDGPLDPAVAARFDAEKRHELAWLKVCLDGEGNVTGAHVREATSLAAARAFGEAAKGWRFRPFMVGRQAMPVCAMVRMTYPQAMPTKETIPFPMAADEPVTVSPLAFESRRISGEKAITPDDRSKTAIAHAGIRRVIGAFRLCIDTTGHVAAVRTLRTTGIPSYDDRIVAAIKTWVYQPYVDDGQVVPACTAVTFIYIQR